MVSGVRPVGIIGAVLILVALVIAGVGTINEAVAESSEINCTVDCQFAQRNATNATLLSEELVGAGFIVGGVGAGLVFIAAIVLMGRRPPPPPWEGAPAMSPYSRPPP